jgi:ABC-type oligopeptide transport system ATPase subunit
VDLSRRSVGQVVQALESVGLTPGDRYLSRFPHELSGGQRQRLGIAGAVAARPKLIIADEPLSGADVSVRGSLLNLFIDLQKAFHLSYLFITHDISVARAFAHRVIDRRPAAPLSIERELPGGRLS